jgi:hypothetical protein
MVTDVQARRGGRNEMDTMPRLIRSRQGASTRSRPGSAKPDAGEEMTKLLSNIWSLVEQTKQTPSATANPTPIATARISEYENNNIYNNNTYSDNNLQHDVAVENSSSNPVQEKSSHDEGLTEKDRFSVMKIMGMLGR